MTFDNFTTSLLSNAIVTNDVLNSNGTNAVLSPISILVNLFIALLGAEGKTRENLDTALWDGGIEYKIEKIEKVIDNVTYHEEVVKRVVNVPKHELLIEEAHKWIHNTIAQKHFRFTHAIYLQEGYKLKSEFQDSVQNLFKEVRPRYNFVNFESGDLKRIASNINGLMERYSDGVMTGIANDDTLSKSDRLVLVSTAFFTDPWEMPFDSLLTMRGSPFYLMGPKREEWVPVNMMQLRGDGRKFNYAENIFGLEGTQSIQLPYQHTSSLILVLPASNSKEDIEKFMQVIKTEGKNFLKRLLEQHSETSLRFVQVPRMILEANYDLKDTLKNAEITNLFEKDANLNGMITNQRENEMLSVSKVLHKVIVPLMDERVEVVDNDNARLVPGGQRRVTFNRPFFAFLLGFNQRLFFSTLVMNPNQSQ